MPEPRNWRWSNYVKGLLGGLLVGLVLFFWLLPALIEGVR